MHVCAMSLSCVLFPDFDVDYGVGDPSRGYHHSCWCAAVCCSVLQCVAVGCSVMKCDEVCCRVLQCVAVCCSV